MPIYIAIVLGSIAGLHAASYGAYKDSPHEGFKLGRYFREIVLSIIIALVFAISLPRLAETTTKLIFFLVVLAWSRIITEAYKLFFRTEPQENYLIPTQVHFFRKIVTKRYQRVLLGMFTAGSFVLFLSLANYTNNIFRGPLLGAFIGLTAGTATALGGGYKDGLFEGFSIRKFFRSPVIGLISGFALASANVIHTHTPELLFFGSIGLERMIVECYKGFLKPGYSPGKFKHKVAPYPDKYIWRKALLFPYLFTWVFFMILFFISSPNFFKG